MPRKDYDEIKAKFQKFVETWKTKEVSVLEEMIEPEIICHMSTVKAYTDGSQHSIYGVKNFVLDFPTSDLLHTRICNYVCRICDNEAHQIGHVVGVALNHHDQVEFFEFTAMFSNHWLKSEQGWKINEMRMDICPHGGDIQSFYDSWYFDKPLAQYYTGVHFPCIQGELDSPWKQIPDSEDILSEEEKIQETLAKYNFGVDQIVFGLVDEALSDKLIGKMPPWGPMDKRHYMECLKFHRQKDRYWAHPVKIQKIEVEGHKAVAHLYRMAGHRQRNHPYAYTKENLNIEHACGRYVLHFEKEGDLWKIVKWNYYLGIFELGPYDENLYI